MSPRAAAGTGEVTGNITGVAGRRRRRGRRADQVLASASELSRQSEHLSSKCRASLIRCGQPDA